ncbi:hypothetical protein ABB05_00010 [Lederbergia galactosidilytica]|uniref:Uncharacterized protein n=1 Tax=Lederbergia galactosidilytica TaxID=217031 RepID=A0A178A722_9BACI|nr:hypothetical protein ABB05_00010 [Lederbergia galactosidilytica]
MDRGPPTGVPYPHSRGAIYKTRERQVEAVRRSNPVHRCWIGEKWGETGVKSGEVGRTGVKHLRVSSVGVSGVLPPGVKGWQSLSGGATLDGVTTKQSGRLPREGGRVDSVWEREFHLSLLTPSAKPYRLTLLGWIRGRERL